MDRLSVLLDAHTNGYTIPVAHGFDIPLLCAAVLRLQAANEEQAKLIQDVRVISLAGVDDAMETLRYRRNLLAMAAGKALYEKH